MGMETITTGGITGCAPMGPNLGYVSSVIGAPRNAGRCGSESHEATPLVGMPHMDRRHLWRSNAR